ncbi:YqeB family protein [Nocardiopsis coralliicola]
MDSHDRATAGVTTVSGSLVLRLLFPVIGAAAGLLLKWAAAWITALPFAPLQGPLRLLESLPEPGATVGAAALGGIAGVVLAFLDDHYSLVLVVSPERAVLRRLGSTEEHGRSAVGAAFLDGKRLVLLGPDTRELVRIPCELGPAAVRRAFEEHGWPWCASDPYAEEFERWVPGLPNLSDTADALLRARAEALAADSEADAEELRRALAAEGVAVRDEKKRQYWRRAGGLTGG